MQGRRRHRLGHRRCHDSREEPSELNEREGVRIAVTAF